MISLLLIEDDPRVSSFLQRGLTTEGYVVDLAADGKTGVDLAVEGRFDLIILDGRLPRLSGREVLEKVRLAGVTTPILMLTAMDATQDKVAGLKGGADDYLTKPFDFDELLARLEALSRRSPLSKQQEPSAVVIGSIELDRQTMVVKADGQPIELTATEFQLLDLLIASNGKVLSRERILNKVWGLGADPLTNVIDVYIRRLRSKLGLDAESGLIKTVRGFGYRFSVD
jgi:DNA-binding response OmpR family regulator